MFLVREQKQSTMIQDKEFRWLKNRQIDTSPQGEDSDEGGASP